MSLFLFVCGPTILLALVGLPLGIASYINDERRPSPGKRRSAWSEGGRTRRFSATSTNGGVLG